MFQDTHITKTVNHWLLVQQQQRPFANFGICKIVIPVIVATIKCPNCPLKPQKCFSLTKTKQYFKINCRLKLNH